VAADLRDADLSRAFLYGIDLSEALLSRADLREADLSLAQLCGALLSEVDMSGARLRGANLCDADLRGALLSEADLSEADLRGALLSEALLRGTHLHGARCDGANLSHAFFEETCLADNDFRLVKGLAEINHLGPSHMALSSVKLPQDGSALHFLRGVGVPEEWISDYRSHAVSPIQPHTCSLAYTSRDEPFARHLHVDLQDQGVRCWLAPNEQKTSGKLSGHFNGKLVLVLSRHVLTSTWIETEVKMLLEKERHQRRQMLFPVRIDESVMQTNQAWIVKLHGRHIGDFRRWTDPVVSQQAFERLLRDLKAERRQC
jgi:hypothetical protein